MMACRSRRRDHRQPLKLNMENKIVIDSYGQEHIVIDRGNEEFTSMLKSTYDEMIAAQSTPSIPEGGN